MKYMKYMKCTAKRMAQTPCVWRHYVVFRTVTFSDVVLIFRPFGEFRGCTAGSGSSVWGRCVSKISPYPLGEQCIVIQFTIRGPQAQNCDLICRGGSALKDT